MTYRNCENVPDMVRVGDKVVIMRNVATIRHADGKVIVYYVHPEMCEEVFMDDEAEALWNALCDWSYSVQ